MPAPVRLLSTAIAVPPYELPQVQALEVARQLFGARFAGFDRMAQVFASTGIQMRHLVKPVDWYLEQRGWPERTAAYLEGALDLFCEAATAALDEAGLTGPEVDMIVTVSSTGIATPSLEARAMGRMGFRSDAVRVPVFGLGCAGGASGLALASRLAASSPGAVVLMVAVETCSLAFRTDELTKANIVATALFGDGAAACVLRAGEAGFAEIAGCAERTWPDTLDIMGWKVDPTGFGVIFDRAIPPFAQANLRPAMDEMLAEQDLSVDEVDRFICHPGGTKVVEALESCLDLGQGALDHERAVLADHGNMSAPTVLHVLDRARKTGLPKLSVVTSLGPGFTASTVTLAA
ncbi:type III polyketide synthase [soil metagenome]